MRRRTSLVGTALAVALLALGAAIAPAAKTKSKSKSKPKPVPVKITTSCTTSVTVQPPPGQSQVVAPVSKGTEYGPVKCNDPLLGEGVQMDTFTVAESGDTVGSYKQYFNTGTIHGTFDLTPGEAPPPTPATIAAETYTGTLTVDGGTGAYAGAKGTGTSQCGTPDGVHTGCVVSLKLTLPPVVKTTKKP